MAIGLKYRLQTSHTRFVIAFSVLLYAICNALNLDKLARWFRQPDGLDYSAVARPVRKPVTLAVKIFAPARPRLLTTY